MGFTSPPYWVGKEYELQESVEAIDDFIRRVCTTFAWAIKKDQSRIVINTSTGFTTSFDKRKKRQVLLLIDKWANNFYELGWNLRHVRHWLKEGQLMSTAPITDLIDQYCEFLGTFEADEGKEMVFGDVVTEDEVNLIETFYNTSGISRGQERTGEKWALRSYWADIRGTANADGHCAAFPLELPSRHLKLYTKIGEVVVDPFLGSGTTICACEILGRLGRGTELEPKYCSVALERLSEMGLEPRRYDAM